MFKIVLQNIGSEKETNYKVKRVYTATFDILEELFHFQINKLLDTLQFVWWAE